VSALGDLSHALRWHGDDVNAVIALMTDAVSGAPCGVQRIFINPNDGSKVKKWMLGNAGAIRISRDEDVTLGLGLTEGIEDALSVLQFGWTPVWAASSADGIRKFPVLSGIEALTIHRNDNAVGIKAADECATRWHSAGREVYFVSLKDNQS
jgi:putative DNA primase/helicase